MNSFQSRLSTGSAPSAPRHAFFSQIQSENSIYRLPYSQVWQKPFGAVEARMPMGPESPAKRALFGILVLHAASIRFVLS